MEEEERQRRVAEVAKSAANTSLLRKIGGQMANSAMDKERYLYKLNW